MFCCHAETSPETQYPPVAFSAGPFISPLTKSIIHGVHSIVYCKYRYMKRTFLCDTRADRDTKRRRRRGQPEAKMQLYLPTKHKIELNRIHQGVMIQACGTSPSSLLRFFVKIIRFASCRILGFGPSWMQWFLVWRGVDNWGQFFLGRSTF